MGYHLSDSLSLKGSLNALKMSLRELKETEGLIHHSDRGIQYCSNQYTQLLKEKRIRISMSGKGNAYENAIAERVNGILKIEYFPLKRGGGEYSYFVSTIKYSLLCPHLVLNN